MDIISVAKVLFAILTAVVVARQLVIQRRNYGFVLRVWRRFRFRMFFLSLCLIALTIVAALVLLQVPILRYGWANLFFDGASNVLVQPIVEGAQSGNRGIRTASAAFFAVLLVLFPFFAKLEEEMFRRGKETWSGVVGQSIEFGLVHCVVGLPVAVGIALIIPGFYFGYVYKSAYDRCVSSLGHEAAQDEAIMASTAIHTMYNTTVLSPLLIGVLLLAIF